MGIRDITEIDPEARMVAQAIDAAIADFLASQGIIKRTDGSSITRTVVERAIQLAINKRLERLMRESGHA